MKMKTFHALTMQDALRAIKQELGPDAVILSSRQIRTGNGIFGLFGRTMFEVTAAVDGAIREAADGSRQNVARPRDRREDPHPGDAFGFQKVLGQSVVTSPSPSQVGWEARLSREWEQLQAEVRELRQAVQQSLEERRCEQGYGLANRLSGLPQYLVKAYDLLISNEMEPDHAERLIRSVKDTTPAGTLGSEQAVRQALLRALCAEIKVSGPLLKKGESGKTVVFVGPTGVGKTTTIAKLAAHYKMNEKRSVALITLDTYRVAAVEQLRLYANIIGVTVDVALTKREALEFIRRRSKADLLFIDTAGRSPMDATGIKELQQLIDFDPPLEAHLVLSATTRERDQMEAMSRFSDVPIHYLLFTKLDECSTFAGIYHLMQRCGLPLSYFSTGQNVPEDLEVATPERLADLLLGGELRGGKASANQLAPTDPADQGRSAGLGAQALTSSGAARPLLSGLESQPARQGAPAGRPVAPSRLRGSTPLELCEQSRRKLSALFGLR